MSSRILPAALVVILTGAATLISFGYMGVAAPIPAFYVSEETPPAPFPAALAILYFELADSPAEARAALTPDPENPPGMCPGDAACMRERMDRVNAIDS